MNRRSVFRPREILPLGLLLTSIVGLYLYTFLGVPSATTVRITVDGTLFAELSTEKAQRLAIGEDLILVIENGAVSAEHASCRDQVCVRTGKITKRGEAIICLPARVSAVLNGGVGYDAITY